MRFATRAAAIGLLAGIWLMLAEDARGMERLTSPVYETYNEYCKRSFGAEKEPLVRQRFGKDLVIYKDSLWLHGSEVSATVAFQTNLPAKTHVEYGDGFRQKTAEPERHFSIHVHHLAGLAKGPAAQYRIVAVDEQGKRIVSETMTAKLGTPANVVRIPEDVQGPPYILDRPGACYLVTKDLVCDGTAFEFKDKVANVTLDLGGHTVVYNEKRMGKISGNFHAWAKQSAVGVRAYGASGMKVLNGSIVQGRGNDGAQSSSIGFSPVYLRGCTNAEIAGVDCVYRGSQLWGVYHHWPGAGSHLHHNVFKDLGKEMINRHGAGSRAIGFYGSASVPACSVHHNLVKRTRQSGTGGMDIHHNEIYVDSYVTNSFAITMGAGGKAYENRVFGGGYHVPAFGWGTKQTAYRNFIHLKSEDLPDNRSKEFGDKASCNGFRLTQYNGSSKKYEDNIYYENIVAIYIKDGRQARGVQVSSDPNVKNYVWRDGIIKIIAEDDRTRKASCLVAQGLHRRAATHLPVIYRNNILITNARHVCFGDDYGTGSNQHVVGCKFVKVGGGSNYRLVTFDTGYPCYNHVIRDPVFEGGASLDAVSMGSGKHDFSLQWTLYVKSKPGTKVTATDAAGAACFSGEVPASGLLEVPLSEYKRTTSGKTALTPHAVTVGGSSKTITMTKRMAFEVSGGTWRETSPPEMKFMELEAESPEGIKLASGGAAPSGSPAAAAASGKPGGARAGANGNGNGHAQKAAKLYRSARQAERQGMKPLARRLYEKLMKEYPDSPLAEKARKRLR